MKKIQKPSISQLKNTLRVLEYIGEENVASVIRGKIKSYIREEINRAESRVAALQYEYDLL